MVICVEKFAEPATLIGVAGTVGTAGVVAVALFE